MIITLLYLFIFFTSANSLKCTKFCGHFRLSDDPTNEAKIGESCSELTSNMDCLECTLDDTNSTVDWPTTTDPTQIFFFNLLSTDPTLAPDVFLTQLLPKLVALRCLQLSDFATLPTPSQFFDLEMLVVDDLPVEALVDVLPCLNNKLKQLSILNTNAPLDLTMSCPQYYKDTIEELKFRKATLYDITPLADFTELKRLALIDNGLTSLEGLVGDSVPKLQYLHVWLNNIAPQSTADTLELLPSLSYVKLVQVPCSTVPHFTKCDTYADHIQSMTLWCSEPPPQAQSLSNILPCKTPQLRCLELMYTNIDTVKCVEGAFPNMDTLNLYANNIVDPSQLVGCVPALRYLNLEANKITDFQLLYKTDFLQLESLLLANNEIAVLPEMTSVDMSCCATQNCTQNAIFCNLWRLSIGNKISTLNSLWFTRFPKLVELDLSDNQIFALPAKVLAPACSLTTIILAGNELSTLPNELFCNNTKIKSINLNRNKFTIMPRLFCSLTNIEYVSFAENGLIQVPSCAPSSYYVTNFAWKKLNVFISGCVTAYPLPLETQNLCQILDSGELQQFQLTGTLNCAPQALRNVYCKCYSTYIVFAECDPATVTVDCVGMTAVFDVAACYEDHEIFNRSSQCVARIG